MICSNCLYRDKTDMNLSFTSQGICAGCINCKIAKNLDWKKRLEKLKLLFEDLSRKKKSKYDLVIGVSGGKDSYFQVHFAKKILNLNPLLVTYYGNNFTKEGDYNLKRMSKIFNCDHYIYRPPLSVLKKMNILGFYIQGDMNWHNHCGIMTLPFIQAVKHKIPIVLYGEHGYMDRAGMFDYDDFVEFSKRNRDEHDLRGFSWMDFTTKGSKKLIFKKDNLNLEKRNFINWAIYPTDKLIEKNNIKGLYLSNYTYWDGVANAKLVKKEYNWKEYSGNFERTYRKISNLDDTHENGAHDYLKFIKFGYGRGTDHSTKDIRLGYMTREEGIEMVKKYDHIRPQKDLNLWFKKTGIEEEEFNKRADEFRHPRIWYIKNNKWHKKNIWGGTSSYGEVFLDKKKKANFQL